MLLPKCTANRQQTTVPESFVALHALSVQERGLRCVGASPLAQKTARKLPFPRSLLLQGGPLTGLVCTAMQADAPVSLPTPIFFTVCFASPKNRLYSAQPPLGRTFGRGTLDGRRWTRNAGRGTWDGKRWTRVPVARLSQIIRLFPGLSRLKCTLSAALTVREKRNRR